MKREKLFDAITDVRDSLILSAERKKRRPLRWIAPVAAAAAIALTLTTLLFPDKNPTVFTPATSALAEAVYPEIPKRPSFEDFFTFDEVNAAHTEWLEQYREYLFELPQATAAPLKDFFSKSIPTLLSGAKASNRACSPVNIYMALSLLSEISGGESREEILDLFHAESIDSLRSQASSIWRALYENDNTKCILANSVWLNERLSYHQEPLNTLASHYYASTYQGEMGSEAYNQQLQDWLNRQTGGLLKDSIQEIQMDELTNLALASTVYFSTKWYTPFIEENTQKQTFHAEDGDLQCDFLNESLCPRSYYWGETFSATSKAFDKGEIVFMLPDEGVTIDQLLQDEKAVAFLAGDRSSAENKAMQVSLSVPKFDISSDLEISEHLKALGITEVFGENADFSPLHRDLGSLSTVNHGTRVAIDEEGCVAAAYTVEQLDGAAPPPDEKLHFVADRPFLFAIYSNGLPLFTGVVHHP